MLTSSTAARKVMREAPSARKSGARASPGRYTRRAKRWNHFLVHREEGLERIGSHVSNGTVMEG